MKIAGYCRISVDLEMDRENTSIENQKSIIQDYVSKKFPDATLDFYADRDRSGYTFEQREEYQRMRPGLLNGAYDILIVKDFSRFARRNSKGLVELEDLRDAGMRIISIGDNIDYPTHDDWTAIQFRFLINEMPVTDTSKKIKAVVKRRQEEGKWICAVPYGYVITNTKTMKFEVDEPAAEIVREVFDKYLDGWGYKKIANYLTERHIPTPRACEKARKEENGEECKIKSRPEWSLVTVQGIIRNDFYIGTLRQHKYTRSKINGNDVKTDEADNVVFENHHTPIVDYKTFSLAQDMMKNRTKSNYRGIKKYNTDYSGYLFCGDCGSPMFSMSRKDLPPAYTCGTYHRRGLKGCTSHHVRVDLLDSILKDYIQKVKENSSEIIHQLQKVIKNENNENTSGKSVIDILDTQIDNAKDEMKMLAKQRAKDIMKHPDREEIIEETYSEMIDELALRIEGLKNQRVAVLEKHNSITQINRTARTVLDVFDSILSKPNLDKRDIGFIVDKIVIYEDRFEIKLKPDIDCLLKKGVTEVDTEETSVNFELGTKSKTSAAQIVEIKKDNQHRTLSANVVYKGSPSLMRMVRRISLGITILPRSSILRTMPVAFIYKFLQNIFSDAVKTAESIFYYLEIIIHSSTFFSYNKLPRRSQQAGEILSAINKNHKSKTPRP